MQFPCSVECVSVPISCMIARLCVRLFSNAKLSVFNVHFLCFAIGISHWFMNFDKRFGPYDIQLYITYVCAAGCCFFLNANRFLIRLMFQHVILYSWADKFPWACLNIYSALGMFFSYIVILGSYIKDSYSWCKSS